MKKLLNNINPYPMKGQLALVNMLLHLRICSMYMQSFINDFPNTNGSRLFSGYASKIDWIVRDMVTNPKLPQEVRDSIKRDVDSDVLVIPAIAEKVGLLSEENRQSVELLIDELLKGEKIIVEKL